MRAVGRVNEETVNGMSQVLVGAVVLQLLKRLPFEAATEIQDQLPSFLPTIEPLQNVPLRQILNTDALNHYHKYLSTHPCTLFGHTVISLHYIPALFSALYPFLILQKS